MLNVVMAKAQRPCGTRMEGLRMGPLPPSQLEDVFADMFVQDWRAVRGDAPLRCIALMDEAPATQFLFPEFLMFQRLFQARGVACVIADPRDLVYRDGAVFHGDQRVDFIYNRHTDFMFDAPHLEPIRRAYLDRAVVVSPHPHGHALYADKRNLTLWTDTTALRGLGVGEADCAQIAARIPRAVQVNAENAATLWRERRQWFFKPFAGYGGKAAYRGDKLTKRVWDDICASGLYIAQRIAVPSERCVPVNGTDTFLKVDVRGFVYRGEVQWIGARIYQGQTTNFRTPGGGFAPVWSERFDRKSTN